MSGIAIDPTALLEGLKSFATSISPMLVVLGVTFGLFFTGRGAYLMVGGRDGRGVQDDVPVGAVIANILAGGALLQFARSVANTQQLLGGAGGEVRAALAYMASGTGAGATFYALALKMATTWVAAIGAVAIFRGILLWRSMGAGENRGGGDDLFWRGTWHIIGGGIALNIGAG